MIRVFHEIGLIPLAAGFVSTFWAIMLLAWLNPRFNAAQDPPPVEAERDALNP